MVHILCNNVLKDKKMSLNYSPKCPGPDRILSTFPENYTCPDCGSNVEIWTDEKKGSCPDCGRIIRKESLQADDETESDLKELIRLACSLGARDAKIISPDDISVEDSLANLCNKSQCKNYGLAPSCPPHVSGPSGFRELQKNAKYALALRIAVPSSSLFSDERKEIMRLLHKITAGTEHAAVRAGYYDSQAFAGGSCKNIFCHDKESCPVLSEDGECPYPHYARPSMSGFGINVSELMKTCGWPSDINVHNSQTDTDSMSWLAGMILIG